MDPCRSFVLVLVISIFARALPVADAGTVSVDPGTQYQTILGWEGDTGVFSTSSSYQTQQMVDRAVNELGLTTFRVDMPLQGDNATLGRSWQFRIDGTNPSKANWASFDTLPGVQYNTAPVDSLMNSMLLPLKHAVEARGNTFTIMLDPAFPDIGSCGPLPTWMQHNAGAYAEYIVSSIEYMKHRYNVVPAYTTIINEPSWSSAAMTPALEAKVIRAMAPMLQAAGLSTKIQLGEGNSAAETKTYATNAAMTPDVWKSVGTVSWHDYPGGTSADKSTVYSTAAAHGAVTAVTEQVGATMSSLYDDLANGNVSYWGQYNIGGAASSSNQNFYYNTGVDGSSVTNAPEYWHWRQLMYYVRPGAVRVGAASSDSNLLSLGFQQSGKTTTVLMNTAAGDNTITVSNLAPGAYGVSKSIGGGIQELGIQTVGAGGTLTVTVPADQALTVYPYAGTNLPPEVYRYQALSGTSSYLQLGAGTSTTLYAGATDPELDSLSYSWTLNSAPAGANVTLVNANTATATANGLTVAGQYLFNVAVSDGHGNTTTKPVGFTVASNQPPMVQMVHSRSQFSPGPQTPLLLTLPQSTAQVMAQVVHDLEGVTCTYNWTLLSEPAGAAATIASPTIYKSNVDNLTVAGDYVFQVAVSDGVNVVQQSVTVTVDPVNQHAPAIFNATGSYVAPGLGHLSAITSDADGDWIANWWDVVSQPAGATVLFADEASPMTDFSVDLPGTYTFQLSTVDRSLYAQSGVITVNITATPEPATLGLLVSGGLALLVFGGVPRKLSRAVWPKVSRRTA